jgi:hypothetical protein
VEPNVFILIQIESAKLVALDAVCNFYYLAVFRRIWYGTVQRGSADASISDPGCFIPDSGSGSEHLSIPDPGSYITGVKKKIPFFLLLMVSGAYFNSKKIIHPGSRKNLSRIRGVKKHRIPDPT